MTGGSLLCLAEPSVDVLIGGDLVGILFGGKRSYQNGSAAVQGIHDVLVATAGARWESASIIYEDAGDRDDEQGTCRCVGSVACWCGYAGAVSCSSGEVERICWWGCAVWPRYVSLAVG